MSEMVASQGHQIFTICSLFIRRSAYSGGRKFLWILGELTLRRIFMASKAVRDIVSDEEWQLRIDLAAFYRIVSVLGMTDNIYNHISARVPGARSEFLINPFGLNYSEITASNLLKVDLDGNVVLPSPSGFGFNPAGFVIHSAIHGSRHDLICLAHTHTPAGVAVASLKCGLLPINQNAMKFVDDLAYHDYEGISLQDDEKKRLVLDFGQCSAMILRNHGLLVGGRSVAETYLNLHCLETACRMQVETLSCGQSLQTPSDESVKASAEIYASARKAVALRNYPGPELEWNAARRRLDAITKDYMN
jgi:ribulose-5-phosphate 4-epimerase/fuculose-1-phosphate aldolase